MKKIIPILFLSILIMGLLPAVFAQEATQIRNRIQAISTESENATPVRTTIRERLQTARQNILEARERYRIARAGYKEAKENYIDAKQKMTAARTRVRECFNNESEECVQLRQRVNSHYQDFLINLADRVLNAFDKIGERVENSNITDEEKEDILADIAEATLKVENARAVIENLTNESTKEDIREATQTIKDAWRETRVVLKKSTGRLINARIGLIIVKAEQLEIKMQRIADKLTDLDEEIDVSDLDNLTEKFGEAVDEAKEKWEKAKEKYAEATTPGEVDELMKEANQYVREAHQKLKEAHEILKDYFRALMNKKRANEALTAVETGRDPVNVKADIKKIQCLEDSDCRSWQYCNEKGECEDIEEEEPE